MSTIINGTSSAITFPDTTVQNTAFTTGSVTQSTIATGVAGTGPAFSAYVNTSQVISASTSTKLQFNAERFDTANAFDSTTNYRFTPLVAGYYQININYIGGNAIDTLVILYKNGSEYGSSGCYEPSFGARPRYAGVVYLNGSTDYLEAYAFVGGTTTLSTNIVASEFSGALVRAA